MSKSQHHVELLADGRELDMDDTEESKDFLGRTYEYCIAQFVAYGGVKGGEFYTPASIVKTIVAVLRPFSNCRVYDKIIA